MCGNIKSKPRFYAWCRFSVTTHFLLCEICKREVIVIDDYKDMYYKLFNKITDIIEELKEIQCQMEEKYIGIETSDKK